MAATADIKSFLAPEPSLDSLLPEWTRSLADLQTAIPELAKNSERVAEIDSLLQDVPTLHRSVRGDARTLHGIEPESVHLVLTSPPYWNLKECKTAR